MLNMNSSNPVLNDQDTFSKVYGKDMFATAAKPATATLTGVVNKTGLLVLIAVVAGGIAYATIVPSMGWLIGSGLAAFGIAIGLGFVMRGNPKASVFMAPIYAIVEGVFLGIFTKLLDGLLVKFLSDDALAKLQLERTADDFALPQLIGGGPASLALPAFLITIVVTGTMLGLFYTGILKPTKRFQAIVGTAVLGVMVVYMLSFVLGMFGVAIPFLTIGSALEGGTAAWIGIGISLLILGIAALSLIIDFGLVQNIVNSGQPKYMEWYAGFALLVTLAWIYYEAVKLSFRLAILFANRD